MKLGQYELYRYVLPLITSNMYIIRSNARALVIDPHENEEAFRLLEDIEDITIILTHEHFDHISGVNVIRRMKEDSGGICTVYAGKKCAEAITDPDNNLSSFFNALFITRSDEERNWANSFFRKDYACNADKSFEGIYDLRWEDLKIILRNTPGHSPGSICCEIYDMKGELLALVTGDSLVQGNKVITRLPNSSKTEYRNVTRPYLESFGPDTTVLPGHGEISRMRNLELG